MNILIYDSVSIGEVHAPFNAACLKKIIKEHSIENIGATFTFHAERDHIDAVNFLLGEKDIKCISFEKSFIKSIQNKSFLMRVFSHFKLIISKINFMLSFDQIHFLTATKDNFLPICFTMGFKKNILCYLHGDISEIGKKLSFKRSILNYRHLFFLTRFFKIKWIVLGNSIKKNIENKLGTISNLHAIEHPYLMKYPKDIQYKKDKITLGYLGSEKSGLFKFINIADQLKHDSSIDFVVNGFNKSTKDLSKFGVSSQPLSRSLYESNLNKIDYVVMTGDPEHYSYSASGTFLDAISFLKPIIFLSNDYIDEYYFLYPGIGYRCKNLSEIIHTIKNLKNNKNYTQHKNNIFKLSKLFAVD